MVKSLSIKGGAISVYSEEIKDLGPLRQTAILLQLHPVMV